MSVRVITPPAPILSWDQTKAHLREDTDDERTYVEGLIAAASGWIDGPEGWVGTAFVPQLLEWRLSTWPNADQFRLPMGPELEIDSVTYVDPNGAEQQWPFPTPLYFDDLPSVRGREGDIRIRYWVGYGARDDADPDTWVPAVPKPVCQAVLLLVGQWFNTRSNVQIGDAVNQMPMAVEALLAPYRSWN